MKNYLLQYLKNSNDYDLIIKIKFLLGKENKSFKEIKNAKSYNRI